MLRSWKKAVSLVLVFVMSMMVCVPAFAADPEKGISSEQIDDVLRTGKEIDCSKQYVVFSKTETGIANRNRNIPAEASNVVNKVQTNVELISLDGKVGDLLDAISANGGSLERSKSDGSYSATITTRVYYTEYEQNGKQYYGVDKAVGNLEGDGTGSYLGSNVYIVDNYATIGQEGYVPNGTVHSSSHTYNLSNSTRSWTYSTPSSWKNYPVADSSSNHAGANYFITLQRGSKSWELKLSNDVFGRNNF